jgi:hypothetical protein
MQDIAPTFKFLIDGMDDGFGNIIRVKIDPALTAVTEFGDKNEIGGKRIRRRQSGKHHCLAFLANGGQLLFDYRRDAAGFKMVMQKCDFHAFCYITFFFF